MIELIAIVLGILVVTLGYTTFNLLHKTEKAEDILTSYKSFIDSLQEQITTSDNRLKEIDRKGSFDSDDEIGWFLKEIQKIQNSLSQFKSNV